MSYMFTCLMGNLCTKLLFLNLLISVFYLFAVYHLWNHIHTIRTEHHKATCKFDLLLLPLNVLFIIHPHGTLKVSSDIIVSSQ